MAESSSKNTVLMVLGSLAAIFGVMTIWAMNAGTEIVDKSIPEEVFEKEAVSSPHATFELTRTTPIQLSVDGATLNDSWLWVKTVIADENNRPVADYTFNLSYYSGSGWSEGDPEDYQVLVLPAGKYKVIAYGEDPKRSKGWTDESRERLNISVKKGVVLARYPLAGLILTLLIGLGYLWSRGGVQVESSGEFEFDDDF